MQLQEGHPQPRCRATQHACTSFARIARGYIPASIPARVGGLKAKEARRAVEGVKEKS